MNLLIKNGRIIDPAANRNEKLDILIENSLIKKIAPNIVGIRHGMSLQIIDASRYVVVPGLIDVHTHLREPGEPEKETIFSGSRAAAEGGFTTICCQPNTHPRIDTPQKVKEIINRAEKDSLVNLYTSACITIDHCELVDIKAIKSTGAVALTDDGDPVIQDELMEEGLRQAKKHDILVSPHSELSPWAQEVLKIKDYTQEPFFVRRDIKLAKKTDSKIHISHVSMEESIIEIARAKREGVQVTCEVTPHHLILDSNARELYGTNAKVNPPLRSSYDVSALKDAIRDGTVDVIASDHAPHLKKSKQWDKASFGIIGLETTLGLILTHLVKSGIITLRDAIAKMTINPARIFNLKAGKLSLGMPADITIIDLEKEWQADVNKFKSKSRNSPFHGWKLRGKAVMTIVNGEIVMFTSSSHRVCDWAR